MKMSTLFTTLPLTIHNHVIFNYEKHTTLKILEKRRPLLPFTKKALRHLNPYLLARLLFNSFLLYININSNSMHQVDRVKFTQLTSNDYISI